MLTQKLDEWKTSIPYVIEKSVKIAISTAAIGVGLYSSTLSLPSFAQESTSSDLASSMVVPASPQEARSLDLLSKKCSPRVSVTSQPIPLPGQKHCSSANFDLNRIKVGQAFKVTTRQGVSFNLKRDIQRKVDPIVVQGMKAGYYKRVLGNSLYPVYIADPSGAGTKSFKISFCGL